MVILICGKIKCPSVTVRKMLNIMLDISFWAPLTK